MLRVCTPVHGPPWIFVRSPLPTQRPECVLRATLDVAPVHPGSQCLRTGVEHAFEALGLNVMPGVRTRPSVHARGASGARSNFGLVHRGSRCRRTLARASRLGAEPAIEAPGLPWVCTWCMASGITWCALYENADGQNASLHDIAMLDANQKGCNTGTSREVTHPSTTPAQARLTAEF